MKMWSTYIINLVFFRCNGDIFLTQILGKLTWRLWLHLFLVENTKKLITLIYSRKFHLRNKLQNISTNEEQKVLKSDHLKI